MRLRFLLNLARISIYSGTHLISITRIEIKEGDALLLIVEAFGATVVTEDAFAK